MLRTTTNKDNEKKKLTPSPFARNHGAPPEDHGGPEGHARPELDLESSSVRLLFGRWCGLLGFERVLSDGGLWPSALASECLTRGGGGSSKHAASEKTGRICLLCHVCCSVLTIVDVADHPFETVSFTAVEGGEALEVLTMGGEESLFSRAVLVTVRCHLVALRCHLVTVRCHVCFFVFTDRKRRGRHDAGGQSTRKAL